MSTNDTSTHSLLPPKLERFLIDSDTDPELVLFLRKIGFRATHVTWQNKLPNDDTSILIWARKHDYIIVCHYKHRDAETKYSFYSEMYYRGGQVIRVGKPGQSTLRLLGCILAQRHVWQEHFKNNSGEAVVHPSGCNFTDAQKLFDRSRYTLRLPFDDPSFPLKSRKPLSKTIGIRKSSPNINQLPLPPG